MRLRIAHTTLYSYDQPVPYALQRVRLTPQACPGQSIASWSVNVAGANEEVRFFDQFGNDTRLLSVSGDPRTIEIVARGEVDTTDVAGVTGPHTGFVPLWLFEHPTALTTAGSLIAEIVTEATGGTEIERLHALSHAIRSRVTYIVGTTDSATSAEEAVQRGSGVCQDHSHIFLAAARKLGFPARYVSGYLMINDVTEQVATHAWAEAHVAGLGWVAFDISNGVSPDLRYVRLATGRDYRDAMPISGIRLGSAQERLEVHITVEQ
jgi:transglutaminase-like putative cysteine protease